MFPGKRLAHAAGPGRHYPKTTVGPEKTSDRVLAWVIFVFFVALLGLIIWLASISPAPENGIPYWGYPM
jgi:hypothetical protein